MLTVVGFPSSKKMKRNNNLKNLIVPFIKFKSSKKGRILFECVVSTSMAKRILEGMLVTKGKLKFDVNAISNLIRAKNM